MENLTLENSKLVEENRDLHDAVEALHSKAREIEEETSATLMRLAEDVTQRDELIKKNEELLAEANQRVCVVVCVCANISFLTLPIPDTCRLNH